MAPLGAADICRRVTMEIEITDPAYMESFRAYLQRQGCPSELRSNEVVEVRVLWSPEAPLSDAEVRAKLFGHLRDWCAANPGVKANFLS
jgi:hypothetical protein